MSRLTTLGVVVLSLLGGLILSGVLLAVAVLVPAWVERPAGTPQLIAGECFAKVARERWDLEVEGQVFEAGNAYYLVVFHDDLTRNRWQLQYAVPVPMSDFERTFQRVGCPKRW